MNKTKRGWRLIRRDEHTYVWISPLGRKHVVTIDPISPPLPDPVPRERRNDIDPVEAVDDASPSFASLTRRGRPLTTTDAYESSAPPESDPDPPPF
jgi:hypothetical protein